MPAVHVSRVLWIRLFSRKRGPSILADMLPCRSVPPAALAGQTKTAACGVASDRVCRAPRSPGRRVSSCLTVSLFPADAGYLLSVVLSLGSPPADVIRYPAL